MLEYILGLIAILVIWGVVKYLKWKQEVYDVMVKLPGPKAYPFVGNMHLFSGAKRSDIFKIFDRLRNEHGQLFRMFSGFVPNLVIMKPEHLELIMTSSVHTKKGIDYEIVKEWLGDGLLVSDGAKWHQRRKMITPTFHFKILEQFMTVFIEKGKMLLDQLDKECNGKAFDVYPYITNCTLDILCETSMGVEINAMSDKENSYARAIYDFGGLMVKKQLNIFQSTPLYPYLKEGKEFYQNLNVLHAFTRNVITERRKYLEKNPIKKVEEDDFSMSKKKRLSFLDLLLDASDKLSDEDLMAEVDTFMFEGHDTTTAGICWSLLLFGLNQDVQEKAYEEIKAVLGDRKTPESLSELNDLKYLECCIKEALRLFPSVPMVSRLLTEDITIDGYRIPKGTDVILDIFHAHRNPDVYPDPDKYDPERFFPENSKSRHAYAYVPFSAGPRNCIGQKFAMYEEKTLLSTILRSFKIKPADTLENIEVVFELVLRPEGGLKIALEKRSD